MDEGLDEGEEQLFDVSAYRSKHGAARGYPHAPEGMRIVKKSELKAVMRSKLDIYNILTKEGQLYLPPYNECSMQFINDIMMGKKKVSVNMTSHCCA